MKNKLYWVGTILSFLIFISACILAYSNANNTITLSFLISLIFFGLATYFEFFKLKRNVTTRLAKAATWILILGIASAFVYAPTTSSGTFLDLKPFFTIIKMVIGISIITFVLNVYTFVVQRNHM